MFVLGIACSNVLFAQSSGFQIPDSTSNSYNWCAPNSNILVFYDDFNGTTLNPLWLTYRTWKGMPMENDNWPESRAEPEEGYTPPTSKTIFLDKNVNVSGGNLILSTFREPTYWRCDTCVSSPYIFSPFTSGMIALPYNNKALNHAKLEVRAQFPAFNYGHHAIWFWFGDNCINEIDLIETYSPRPNDVKEDKKRKSHGAYDTHEWNNKDGGALCGSAPVHRISEHHASTMGYWYQFSKPKTFMRHAYKRNRFGSEDRDWNRSSKIYDMTEWHTYTLDWDSTELIFKMDGFEVGAIPKWYRPGLFKTYPKCDDNNKNYKFNRGFAWDKVSLSQLRIGSGMFVSAIDPTNLSDDVPNPLGGHLGDMKVDYVKIWQSALSSAPYNVWTEWTDPCQASSAFRIIGKSWLCSGNTETYTVNNSIPGAYWEIPAGFSTTSSIYGQSVTLTRTNSLMYTNGVLKYHYRLSENCPWQTLRFNLYCNIYGVTPAQPTVVPIVDNMNNISYFFFDNMEYVGLSRTEDERKKYNWTLSFQYPDTTITVVREGRFFEIPAKDVERKDLADGDIMNFDLKMEVVISFPFEETAITVEKIIPNFLTTTSVYPIDGDSSVTVWHAAITNIDSFNAEWNARVEDFLFWDYELDNPTYFEEIRHQIKSEMLLPYVLEMQDSTHIISEEIKSISNDIMNIYPNPNSGQFNINVNVMSFDDLVLDIYDIHGKLILKKRLFEKNVSIDLVDKPNGMYFIQLRQNGKIIESEKIIVNN